MSQNPDVIGREILPIPDIPSKGKMALDARNAEFPAIKPLRPPTRQALLTGRNHHSAGMGSVAEVATGAPGNDSVRPNTVATIAEMLRLNGYNTGAVGKMHQTPAWEVSMPGPFAR